MPAESRISIGTERAQRLEAYLKSLGVLDPLHFSHSWCRWSYGSLTELTQAEGNELIMEAKKAIRVLGVKSLQKRSA